MTGTLQIQINGEAREIPDGFTLGALVAELSLAPERIAIEHNQQVVRRKEWIKTVIADGDRIEIVHFVGGGAVGSSQREADGGQRYAPSDSVSV